MKGRLMGKGDTSVTHGDTSKTRCVTPQTSVGNEVTNRVTHVTHFPYESHVHARGRAHAEVTEKSVTMCHLSPDADAQRYAVQEADEASKPVYRPGDDFLEFKRSVRLAALDVMILTFAALRHAQWLARLGVCPPDVARQIERHIKEVARIVRRTDADVDAASRSRGCAGSPQDATRSPRRARTRKATPGLFDATGANTAASGAREAGQGGARGGCD